LKKTIGFFAFAMFAAFAQAQTFESNMNSYETPIGMTDVRQIDSPASASRDAKFNAIRTNSSSGTFSSTAIGNLINVQNYGSNNTIVINANQVNTGSQNASVNLNSQSSATNSSY
jgi:hypothetical protein